MKVKPQVHRKPCIRQRISESNFTQPHELPSQSEVKCPKFQAGAHGFKYPQDLRPVANLCIYANIRTVQIGFTFLVPAHLGSPGKMAGKRAVKRVCVCVCVCVCVRQT